jgi:hypothetical protein
LSARGCQRFILLHLCQGCKHPTKEFIARHNGERAVTGCYVLFRDLARSYIMLHHVTSSCIMIYRASRASSGPNCVPPPYAGLALHRAAYSSLLRACVALPPPITFHRTTVRSIQSRLVAGSYAILCDLLRSSAIFCDLLRSFTILCDLTRCCALFHDDRGLPTLSQPITAYCELLHDQSCHYTQSAAAVHSRGRFDTITSRRAGSSSTPQPRWRSHRATAASST